MWDDVHGISGEGYTRIEMTFANGIAIRQSGHALVHIDKWQKEGYLIFIPNVKVEEFLSSKLYPELGGTYHIVIISIRFRNSILRREILEW